MLTLGAGALILLGVSPAGAATFSVTRTDDPPAGSCDPTDCSLREAVAASQAAAGTDTIRLGAGTFTLPQDQLPDISQELTIEGAGRTATVITGADTSGTNATIRAGVFVVQAGQLTLSKLAVSGNR